MPGDRNGIRPKAPDGPTEFFANSFIRTPGSLQDDHPARRRPPLPLQRAGGVAWTTTQTWMTSGYGPNMPTWPERWKRSGLWAGWRFTLTNGVKGRVWSSSTARWRTGRRLGRASATYQHPGRSSCPLGGDSYQIPRWLSQTTTSMPMTSQHSWETGPTSPGIRSGPSSP
jgi:hypothetical protein